MPFARFLITFSLRIQFLSNPLSSCWSKEAVNRYTTRNAARPCANTLIRPGGLIYLPTNKQLLIISGLAHRRLHLLDLTMTRSFYGRYLCHAKHDGRNQFTETVRD